MTDNQFILFQENIRLDIGKTIIQSIEKRVFMFVIVVRETVGKRDGLGFAIDSANCDKQDHCQNKVTGGSQIHFNRGKIFKRKVNSTWYRILKIGIKKSLKMRCLILSFT